MLVIVNNGKGADDIARMVRASKQVVAPKDAAKTKASAYILTDGDQKNEKLNVALIKKTNKPVLAIGTSSLFLTSAFGMKPVKGKFEKTVKVKIEHPHPLLLDMKRMFTVMNNCQLALEDLPEEFDVFASSSKYDFEIIGHIEQPLFGLHFSPEMGGDGMKIIDNFVKFVEVWEKYHK